MSTPVPQIEVTPELHSFGLTIRNTSAKLLRIVVANRGNAQLVLLEPSIEYKDEDLEREAPFELTLGRKRKLAIGESITLTVRFKPTRKGEKKARLEIPWNNPQGGVSAFVRLFGECMLAESDLELIPDLVQFGAIMPGRSITRQIQLRNRGASSVTVSKPQLAGPNKDEFVVFADSLPNRVIGVFGTKVFYVDFRPRPGQPAGDKVAELVLTTDDPTEPRVSALLLGFATAANLAIDPPAGDFGIVNSGAAAFNPVQIIFQLKNEGSETLTLGKLAVEGTNFDRFLIPALLDRASNATLAPGAITSFSVRFNLGLGPSHAHVRIPFVTPALEPLKVPLEGRSTPGRSILHVDPLKVVFPPSGLEESHQSSDITVRSEGGIVSKIEFGKVKLLKGHTQDFAVIFDDVSGKVFRPGEHRRFRVVFAPTEVGRRAAILVVPSSEGTVEIKLEGQCFPGPLVPNRHDFGLVPLGHTASISYSVTIVAVVPGKEDEMVDVEAPILEGDADDFEVVPNSAVRVRGGGRMPYRVRCLPVKPGRRKAVLVIRVPSGRMEAVLEARGAAGLVFDDYFFEKTRSAFELIQLEMEARRLDMEHFFEQCYEYTNFCLGLNGQQVVEVPRNRPEQVGISITMVAALRSMINDKKRGIILKERHKPESAADIDRRELFLGFRHGRLFPQVLPQYMILHFARAFWQIHARSSDNDGLISVAGPDKSAEGSADFFLKGALAPTDFRNMIEKIFRKKTVDQLSRSWPARMLNFSADSAWAKAALYLSCTGIRQGKRATNFGRSVR